MFGWSWGPGYGTRRMAKYLGLSWYGLLGHPNLKEIIRNKDVGKLELIEFTQIIVIPLKDDEQKEYTINILFLGLFPEICDVVQRGLISPALGVRFAQLILEGNTFNKEIMHFLRDQ